jgi:hypothetical protein
MRILSPAVPDRPIELSIVLVDWSVRHSHHALDYLARQTVERERYELIWIEYYGAVPDGIGERQRRALERRGPPAVDQWIVLDMPSTSYYHKHLMYNVGILAARGRIVNICDSDAMFRSTYVDSILRAFEQDPRGVLHMDELRSGARELYPFRYPDEATVLKGPLLNAVDGMPWGLVGPQGMAVEDRLHRANYGASMSARREDLIAIGGADEHADFLGHVCGPYDLTFRLVNAGHRERWHETEWLIHTWHPGQAGAGNYLGPHDGRDLSSTSLRARRTGRVLPLRENPGIRALRERSVRPRTWGASALDLADAPREAARWSPQRLTLRAGPVLSARSAVQRHPLAVSRLARAALREAGEYGSLVLRTDASAPGERGPRSALGRTLGALAHVLERAPVGVRMLANVLGANRAEAARALHRLEGLRTEGVREVLLFGSAKLCALLAAFARDFGIRARERVSDDGPLTQAQERALREGAHVLIAARHGLRWRRGWLLAQGVSNERIAVIDDAWEDEEPAVDIGPETDPGIDLSIVLPTRGRPQLARCALQYIARHARAPERIEVVLCIDEDDARSRGLELAPLRVRELVLPPGIGMGEITNRGARASRGRHLMLANDDLRIATHGWDKRVIAAADRFADGVALVYTNDRHQGGRLSTFPILPRASAVLLGQLACHRVNHFHIESHLFGIFRELRALGHDRLIYLDDVEIEHVRPTGLARPAQVRGTRDDRVTFASLSDERRRAARLLARAIGGSERRARRAPLERETPTSAIEVGGSAAELRVCWLAPGHAGQIAAQLPECGVPYRLETPGPNGGFAPDKEGDPCEVVLFLGPGAEPEPGWGRALLDAFGAASPRVSGLCGVSVYSRNGRVLRAGLWLERRHGQPLVLDRLRGLSADEASVSAPARVHAGALCGLALRADALRELGEVCATPTTSLARGIELCLRLASKGFEIHYAPRLRLWLADDEPPADACDLERATGTLATVQLPEIPALRIDHSRDGLEIVRG